MSAIKEHNKELKREIASLKAMLQAQVASNAGKAGKQIEVETHITALNAELAQEKENAQKSFISQQLPSQSLKPTETEMNDEKIAVLSEAAMRYVPAFFHSTCTCLITFENDVQMLCC